MTRAKILRLAIHAWLVERSPCSIVQILAAFPGNSVTQVQRAVYLMVRHGNLLNIGQSKDTRYSAASETYKPEVASPVKIGRYQAAATHRQNAINYIIAHPGALGPEIIKAMKWQNKAVGSDRLADMVERGELARTKATITVINASGTRSVINTYAYTALVEKTRGANEMMDAVVDNLNGQAEPVKGRTVHIGGKRTDLKDQRGQGALPYSVRRGCSLGGF